MNKLLKVLKFTVICGIIFVLFSLCTVIYFGYNSKPQKSDCIIVLGCKVYGTIPSPFLASRLDHAVKLYKEGYGNYIIVSGGQGAGEEISEAESMKRYLISKGVGVNSIIKEDKSMTTMENLSNSKAIMEKNSLKTTVIVSNKYHLKRSELIAKYYKINACYSGVFVGQYKSDEFVGFIREVPALVKFYLQYVYYKIF